MSEHIKGNFIGIVEHLKCMTFIYNFNQTENIDYLAELEVSNRNFFSDLNVIIYNMNILAIQSDNCGCCITCISGSGREEKVYPQYSDL